MNSFYLHQFVKDSFLHILHEFHEIEVNVKKYALNCVSWNSLKEIFHSVSSPLQSELLANQILLILCIFNKLCAIYLWSLRILLTKRWFPFNFAKKTSNFYLIFHLIAAFKKCIVEFTAVFVCLLLSWSRRYSIKWS